MSAGTRSLKRQVTRTKRGRKFIRDVSNKAAKALTGAGGVAGLVIGASLYAGKKLENRQVEKMVQDTEKRLKRKLTQGEYDALAPQYREHLRRKANPERKDIQKRR